MKISIYEIERPHFAPCYHAVNETGEVMTDICDSFIPHLYEVAHWEDNSAMHQAISDKLGKPIRPGVYQLLPYPIVRGMAVQQKKSYERYMKSGQYDERFEKMAWLYNLLLLNDKEPVMHIYRAEENK